MKIASIHDTAHFGLLETVRIFLQKTKDQMSLRHVVDQMEESLKLKTGMVWLLLDEKEYVKGYCWCTLEKTEHETMSVFVRQLYIPPLPPFDALVWLPHGWRLFTEKTHITVREIFDSLIHKWAGEKNIVEIYAVTKRNPKAFCRLMKGKWEVDSYVLRRK